MTTTDRADLIKSALATATNVRARPISAGGQAALNAQSNAAEATGQVNPSEVVTNISTTANLTQINLNNIGGKRLAAASQPTNINQARARLEQLLERDGTDGPREGVRQRGFYLNISI